MQPDTATPQRAAEVVTLKQLGPFYDVQIDGGWLRLSIDADEEEWLRLQEVSSEPLWAGSRALPEVLKSFPAVHIVWRDGSEVRESYARAGIGDVGWRLEYRARRIRGPALGMGAPPPAGTSVRPGAEARRLKKSDPLVVRLPELVQAAGHELPPGTLRRFESQEMAGSFGAADRVIAISAWGPAPSDMAMEPEVGLVFTADAAGELVDIVFVDSGRVRVDGLIDIDGDGIDELLTSTHGFEYGSRDLFRLGQAGVERVNLWEHAL